MEQPPLFLEARLRIERECVREQSVPESAEEHLVEFQPLGGVDGHHQHRWRARLPRLVGNQIFGRQQAHLVEKNRRRFARIHPLELERGRP